MAEDIDVTVDEHFLRIGSKSYAIDKIGSVETRRAPPRRMVGPILLALAAILLFAVAGDGPARDGNLTVAGVVAALAIGAFAFALWPRHQLVIVTSGGEQAALTSSREDRIDEVRGAIEAAIRALREPGYGLSQLMARAAAGEAGGVAADAARPNCGVIMPISETKSHGAQHWEMVRTLLHRAINKAGMTPHNVWEGSATDRITSRILSNLFADPIAVCDISDLNANVMLELGMRLASKKPTIVVRESGALIPFDIADFNVLTYPADLCILPMEDFVEQLASELKEKAQAANGGTYRPFLADVEVEFLEPSAKAVPFEEYATSQLQRISDRLDRLDRFPAPVAAGRVDWANPTSGYGPAASEAFNLIIGRRSAQGEGFQWVDVKTDFMPSAAELAALSGVSGVARVRANESGFRIYFDPGTAYHVATVVAGEVDRMMRLRAQSG